MGTDGEIDLPKLAAPARRALSGAGYHTLTQLAKAREADVAELHGMGPTAMRAIQDAMREHGLKFRS